jgi:D-xylose transport system substrate-binding protein
MRMKKLCATLTAAVLLAGFLPLSGCVQATDKPRAEGGRIRIGFSMASLKEERWYVDRDAFVAEAQKLDADVMVDVAYDNADEQLRQVRGMIDAGVDMLVIIPHDAASAAAAVAMAKRAGIKVLSYDRLVRGANVDLYISFDNVKVGELQAEAMLKAVPEGNYVIVKGPPTDYNSVMIYEGIRRVLDPRIKSGDVTILKEFSSTDWMADEAADGINRMLQDNGAKFDAVIAENDSLAGGVINTLSEYRLVPRIPVVGMDADLAACQRVVEGQQLMTVYKPIKLLAAAAADFAVKMARGEEIGVTDTISDGRYDVPYYAITPLAVDKDNMVDAVIRDGFHRMDEVYMNVPQEEWPKP